MKDNSLQKNILGYAFLLSALGLLAWNFNPKIMDTDTAVKSVVTSAASGAVIAVTVSVFWLWKLQRVKYAEKYLGPVGHVLHCGYCLSLWLSAGAVSILGTSLFSTWPHLANFFFSWWTQAFFTVIAFEILSILWFKKVQNEITLRTMYKERGVVE